MRRRTRRNRAWLWLATFAIMGCAAAQLSSDDSGFTPYIGLPGKDVIWLPAELAMVNKMLDLGEVTAHDVVVDLGSGDGRIVIGAAKRGAQAIGVELNGELIALSRRYAAKEGVSGRAQFVQQDLFEFDLQRADVITLFLLDTINIKLRPKLLDLKPGTRIVSNTFTMADWRADAVQHDDAKPDCMFNCSAYLWVIPAKVQGSWRFAEGELTLDQNFQMLQGTLVIAGDAVRAAGELRGAELRITAGPMRLLGRVTGETIVGTRIQAGTHHSWRATRGG